MSVGAYQVGDEEARRFGYTLADMLDLEKSTDCMIKLAEDNLRYLLRYVTSYPSHSQIDYTDASGKVWKNGGLRAYLAIIHNHGMGYTQATIFNYGLDWPSYKQRNPEDNIVSHAYGEDCINGGPYYPTQLPVPPPGYRTLIFMIPNMTGEDVRELQSHLNLPTDGIFGLATETALKAFQKSKGLQSDGVCGAVTWAALLSPDNAHT